MIIGLTGKNCAGKTEVCEYLKKRSFEYQSLSNEIREEAGRRRLEITREVLIELGNELREKHGPGVLAERILGKLETDHNYVIDSIRNPSEVDALKTRSDFTLLAVEADEDIRYERSRKRGRERAAETLQQFIAEEARELDSDNPASQQLLATRQKADMVVTNNGTLEDLHRRL